MQEQKKKEKKLRQPTDLFGFFRKNFFLLLFLSFSKWRAGVGLVGPNLFQLQRDDTKKPSDGFWFGTGRPGLGERKREKKKKKKMTTKSFEFLKAFFFSVRSDLIIYITLCHSFLRPPLPRLHPWIALRIF